LVTPGLDPATRQTATVRMDCSVKPGNDKEIDWMRFCT
jgi:hypothetical protein